MAERKKAIVKTSAAQKTAVKKADVKKTPAKGLRVAKKTQTAEGKKRKKILKKAE